jgi:hypothetical protein
METGRITLPNPQVDLLIAIRQGNHRLSEIENTGKELQTQSYQAQTNSPLPDTVDYEAIPRRITSVYLDFWTRIK